MRHMDFSVASYEGGGFSESPENRKRDKREHRQITSTYMSGAELFRYRAVMALTLAPLRSAMAESRLFSGVYHWIKERIYHRKGLFLAAFLFFLLEMALLVWPVGWLAEDAVHWLAGEGSMNLEVQGNSFFCCQEFRPEYGNLKSISIVLAGEKEIGDGNALITVTDSDNQILFHEKIPYERMEMESYTDIDMNLLLRPGKSYFLSVELEADENGRIPVLKACAADGQYLMPENIRLIQDEEIENLQLVTRYSYRNVITGNKVLRAFLLCALAALGIAFGLPKDHRLRKCIGVILLLAGPYILGRRLELLTVNTHFLLPFSMKWNMGIMYLLELILLLCTCSFPISICVSNVLLTLLYSANYFVVSFRGEPLRLNDFSAIGTAARVVGHYELRPNSHMAMAWSLLVLFLVYGLQTGGRRKQGTKGNATRIRWAAGRIAFLTVGIILALVSGYRLLYTDMLLKAGFMNTHGFDQNMNYHFNGYLVASCMDIQDSRVREPEGYSVKKVEELLSHAGEDTAVPEREKMPHIILIMNESFSDLRVLGNLKISEENLSFFNSLSENTVRGMVNASVLGGGTANSEFEVFTGSSMGFLPPAYYAYQQCMVREIPSLISDMRDLGYTTYSIHPESATNWNRDRVYQYLGFEHSIWIEDFPGAEKVHYGVTDLETYKKVEEIFENRQEDERLFLFNLTVQNHGGYSESDVNRSVTASNVASEEADIYLSLIRESDRAFEQLIRYFEKQTEPVIICMYGDHQPKLSDDFYEKVYSQTEGIEEREKRLNMYKVPFVIWANYDIPEQAELDIGMSYLGGLLLDVAGIPKSSYFSFLNQYREEYPIITINGYEDGEGNFYNWSEDGAGLLEYRILQYNHLFDLNIVEWGF